MTISRSTGRKRITLPLPWVPSGLVRNGRKHAFIVILANAYRPCRCWRFPCTNQRVEPHPYQPTNEGSQVHCSSKSTESRSLRQQDCEGGTPQNSSINMNERLQSSTHEHSFATAQLDRNSMKKAIHIAIFW